VISNEVRQKALKFTKNFEDASYEKGEAQTFWGQFFDIFGVSPRLYKSFFENHTSGGFIDALWPGVVAVEHKSVGRDLDKAYLQARNYLYNLLPSDQPKAVVVCDFQTFRIYSMEATEGYSEFKLKDLPRKLDQFQFLLGGKVRIAAEEDPVNMKAAELMGQLHDRLAERKYVGEQLEVLLVRIMFMFFADDTGIFGENDYLTGYLERNTRDDGTDLGSTLNFLFDLVNMPEEDRPNDYRNNREINGFRYINGGLFAEYFRPAPFDARGRNTLLECARFNWAAVSPAIFGSMFQNVMTAETRRNLGAHYTSETNILKVINPLFMDDLRDQFENSYSNKTELRRLLEKIKNIGIFDPACGCGNFLVISYRELRSLEIDIWKRLAELEHWEKAISLIDITEQFAGINVDNMYGIEIEEFPSQIARAALWLQDHIMNMKVSEAFGSYYVRLPLSHSPNILHDNALSVDWRQFAPATRVGFIASNPPFLGSKYQSKIQRSEVGIVFQNSRSAGILDYVTAWYRLAAAYIEGTEIECGFVSTNSITQGEQVGVLWRELAPFGININFAHRTFAWTSEAKGAAAVFVVIIGFSTRSRQNKTLWMYPDIKGDAIASSVATINPYLVDAPFVAIENRRTPLCPVPSVGIGNKPIDGGYYLFTPEEKDAFIAEEPGAAQFFRRWVGSREFLNGIERWCLWVGDLKPSDIRSMPKVADRIDKVRRYRLGEIAAKGKDDDGNITRNDQTKKLAATPTRFHVENFPDSAFLVLPEVSSERRFYVPFGYLSPPTMASNLVKILPQANQYIFGILSSAIHMSWMRQVAGRLEGRYRYSIGIVYNNFPWPENPTDQQKSRVEEAAQKVLDVRQVYLDQGQTLADLYDPLSMPGDLLQAHRKLDTAVDRCYRRQPFTDETNRLKYLFALYQHYSTGEELAFEE
jgi:hypothetical protein